VNLLPGSADIADNLTAWGIRTFGQFAALPPHGVAARLGAEGTRLHRLARGEGIRHIRPFEDALEFDEEVEPDHPVELLEPLLFLLARALKELCAQLNALSLATDEIRLTLALENRDPHVLTLRLPVPMCDEQTFLKLLQLNLSDHPPGAPVLKLHLRLNPVKPRSQQHGLFIPRSPEPAKLEITLSRLYHLLSSEHVGTPEVLDTYRPDAFRMNRFTAALVHDLAPPDVTHALALRRIRPPLYADVRVQQGKPMHIDAPAVRGEVIVSAGPWRSSGDWWKTDVWDCAEWDVLLKDGLLCRVLEDLSTGRWFVTGYYD
jgi:protein ImuB